jgi:hypothetical protein
MMDGNVNTASMGEMNDQAGLEALVKKGRKLKRES